MKGLFVFRPSEKRREVPGLVPVVIRVAVSLRMRRVEVDQELARSSLEGDADRAYVRRSGVTMQP